MRRMRPFRHNGNLLDIIVENTRRQLAQTKRAVSVSQLEAGYSHETPRSFRRALSRPAGAPIRVIAEFKRASPKAGRIRDGAEPEPIVAAYEQAGASAISVISDPSFFDGRLEFVRRARDATKLPILRKDFIIDPYQVVQSRWAGADALLLIVAVLEGSLLSELLAAASEVRLDALVEVHSEAEAERAVDAGATIIGVNHRDLKTFEIDMGLTERLRGVVPRRCVLVGESGIKTRRDVERLGDAGADAILVGESLMRAKSPGAALRSLTRPR